MENIEQPLFHTREEMERSQREAAAIPVETLPFNKNGEENDTVH